MNLHVAYQCPAGGCGCLNIPIIRGLSVGYRHDLSTDFGRDTRSQQSSEEEGETDAAPA